jgi:hypothetical protein
MARASERREPPMIVPPLCCVAHRRLVIRDADLATALEQRRFEQICARELLGELD